MITRNALYDFIENLVSDSVLGDPLYGAQTARNLRTDVDTGTRVIRVNCWGGKFALVSDSQISEQDVDGSIQCFSTPSDSDNEYMDAAIDDSFEMAKAIYIALASDNTGLAAQVCNTDFEDFESDIANLGGTRRGCTYLFGKVNP